ncbi:hypothetical protein [Pararhodonellum marinum]|uniref:hypothetical protein n=1 Tax=Pararhodonellum marinum TaxID=2755358 RepID=UPI001890AFC2|nr:hypothetical protein [Pararhodonellum marinum]
MNKLIIVGLFFFIASANAQITNLQMNGVPLRTSGYEGVEGSPYLFDDWGKAEVVTKNGGIKDNVSYKLNIHENELVVINESGNQIILDKNYVDHFIVERPAEEISLGVGLMSKLVFKNGFENIRGVTEKDFINVLVEDEPYSLIRKFYSDLVTPPKNSYAPSQGRMFVFEQTFYLINSNGEANSVRNRTNSFISGLAKEDKNLAKSIVKEGKLDLSREDHMVIFVQKLNQAKQ